MTQEQNDQGLPGSLKRAMAEDKKGVIPCPVCGGTGKIDPDTAPQLKAAWDAVTGPVVRQAVEDVVGHALKTMKNPPAKLLRRYRLSQGALGRIKRVKDFAEAAAVLRRLSGLGVSQYVLRESKVVQDGKAMEVEVLHRSQAAAQEGLKLFGNPLELIEEDEDQGDE